MMLHIFVVIVPTRLKRAARIQDYRAIVSVIQGFDPEFGPRPWRSGGVLAETVPDFIDGGTPRIVIDATRYIRVEVGGRLWNLGPVEPMITSFEQSNRPKPLDEGGHQGRLA